MKSPDPDELRRWVANWREWYPASYEILDREGAPVPFRLTPAQVGIHELVQSIQERHEPVRVQVLKSRRAHMSAAVAAMISRFIFFVPGQTAMVVAHSTKAASEIFGYYEHFYDTYNQERGLLPMLPVVAKRKNEYIELEGGGKIHVGSADNADTGRSMRLSFLHLSETAFWRDPVTLRRGLLSCVPDTAGTVVIDESTANGVGTPHHLAWQRNSSGRGGLWRTYFFPWWKHPDAFLEVDEEQVRHLQETLGRLPQYPDEREHAEQFGLTWGQIAWRRYIGIDTKCEGSIESFRQEYPATAAEAFIAAGYCRFAQSTLARQPVMENAPLGSVRREQLGTRHVPMFIPSERGPLWMAARAEPQRKYVMGVDTAQGIDTSKQIGSGDPDYAVIQVVDLSTGMQVARFRDRVQPWVLADIAMALGELYHWPYLIPEVNNHGGAFLREIMQMGWPLDKIHVRDRAPHDLRPPEFHELGFLTTAQSRGLLIGTLDSALIRGDLIVRDPLTLGEMHTFVVNATGKPEAQRGCHDDCVMALALCAAGMEAARTRDTVINAMRLSNDETKRLKVVRWNRRGVEAR
jgi:hypothetical protein